jgi:hypothetical protein
VSEPALFLGLPIQIDLGNLAVGLGTALLAWAGFRTIRSSEQQNNVRIGREAQQRAAELRMQWRERLRDEVANLVRMHRQVSMIRRNGGQESEERSAILELREARAKCEMLFGNDPMHREDQELLRFIASDVEIDYDAAREQRESIVRLARDVLERQDKQVYEEFLRS